MFQPHPRPSGSPAARARATVGFATALTLTAVCTVACTGPTEPDENATQGIPTETNYPEGVPETAADATAPGVGIDNEGSVMDTGPEPQAGADTYEDELGSGAEPVNPIPGHGGEDPPQSPGS
jgi:hypothetical protein